MNSLLRTIEQCKNKDVNDKTDTCSHTHTLKHAHKHLHEGNMLGCINAIDFLYKC